MSLIITRFLWKEAIRHQRSAKNKDKNLDGADSLPRRLIADG